MDEYSANRISASIGQHNYRRSGARWCRAADCSGATDQWFACPLHGYPSRHAYTRGYSASSTPGSIPGNTPGSTPAAATHSPQSRPTVTSSVPMSTSVASPPPTGSVPSPTSTSAPPANWLVVSLSQIAFVCPQTPDQSVQLTNTGPGLVSWSGQINTTAGLSTSASHHPPDRSPPAPA